MIVAGEGELAGQMPVCVLIDDVADTARIVPGKDAVQHDLGDGHLAALHFAARLEIDCVGKTSCMLGA